jgi:hypothetical protein
MGHLAFKQASVSYVYTIFIGLRYLYAEKFLFGAGNRQPLIGN